MSWGIDYASIDGNKPPHLPSLIKAGCKTIWVRGSFTYYDASHKAWACVADPCIARDWDAVGAAPVTRGTYGFLVPEATQTPEEQVAVLYKSAPLRPGIDFPPCIDLEFPHGIAATKMTASQLVDWYHRAVLEAHRLFGVWPLVYTSERVWDDTDADCLGGPPVPDEMRLCALWLARYRLKGRKPAVLPPVDPPPPCPTDWDDEWVAHQNQGDALGVPGMTSTCDIDHWRVANPGDRGGHVLWFKRQLRHLALPLVGPLDTEDDLYDQDLQEAVAELQGSRGLDVDLALGPSTFAAAAWE